MRKRVGVIGGGQLAWMMAEAAQRLAIDLVVQTPKADDPAVAIAQDKILAPVADAQATAELATRCDVITFENEFIDYQALLALEQQGVRFYPRLTSLAPLLDKYHQRCYLRELGLPTPAFAGLDHQPEAKTLEQFGFPVVLKSRRLGYDGQGTYIVRDRPTLEQLIPSRSAAVEEPVWLLEAFVPFERELAVMAARSITGEIVVYPVVETQQVQQVCQRVLVLPEQQTAVQSQVEAIVHRLLSALDYVGVMGIEFFLTPGGEVLVNETAPRTHNSGHYSLDACVTSQFEQQLRAVCGLPLGRPDLTSAGAVMVNLLGFETSTDAYLAQRQRLAEWPQAHLYWYGKTAARPGRKLGHVTVCLAAPHSRSQALAVTEAIETLWYPQGDGERNA